MPSYELLLVIRRLQKPELVDCLKRAANFVFDNNGVLRKIENLGLQTMHRKLSNPLPNAPRFTAANYFLYHVDLPPDGMRKVYEDLRHDTETIRVFYLKKEANLSENYECTLEDELKPPVFRPSVQKLIEEGRKKREKYDFGGDQAAQIL